MLRDPSSAIIWRVRLFDGPVVEDRDGVRVSRFRSNRVAALLAYLALKLGHPVPREELYEALWPEEDYELSANRFRVSLTSLRKQLEPSPTPFGAVLDVSIHGRVRLRPESVWVDAIELERALKEGRKEDAALLVRGEFLPGFYDEWALDERARLDALAAGLERPAIAAAEAAAEQPAPPPAPQSRHRLPLTLTRFFGRELEIEKLLSLLQANRLVTVTGPGGMGKTRLAVETARTLDLPAVFVSLADLTSGEAVPEAILKALGYPINSGAAAQPRLEHALNLAGPRVIILDNAEHLIAQAASTALMLLDACPGVSILVTSRTKLGIPGEAQLDLPPLPAPGSPESTSELLDYPAVRLFADRAKAARPDFAISPANAKAVEDICVAVEGIPLAIELAAARLSVQSPAQIAASIKETAAGLSARLRGVPERHRSLSAAIQGSIDLMWEGQADFFLELSIFRAGWTLEAARYVLQRSDAQMLLSDLVSRSMIRVGEDPDKDGLRYAFLEPIRQFAESRAVESLSDEERTKIAYRHSEYYLSLAAQPDFDDIRELVVLDGELPNLEAAIDRDWHRLDGDYWNGLMGAMRYAFVRGYHKNALAWADRAAPRLELLTDPKLTNKARHTLAVLLADVGRLGESDAYARTILEDAAANSDRAEECSAYSLLGYNLDNRGRHAESLDYHRKALALARAIDDPSLLRRSLYHAARALHSHGYALSAEQSEEARASIRESIALAKEALQFVGAHSHARPLLDALLALNLSFLENHSESYAYLKNSQAAALAQRSMAVLMYGFYYESLAAARFERFERAAIVFGAFRELQEKMGYSLADAEDTASEHFELLRSWLGEGRFDELFEQGKKIDPSTLVEMRIDIPADF